MTYRRIVILTGAGISAESGLGTFRDKDGIWTRYNLEDVATPEGFARDPDFVHEFYNARRRGLLDAQPNAAHEALAHPGGQVGGVRRGEGGLDLGAEGRGQGGGGLQGRRIGVSAGQRRQDSHPTHRFGSPDMSDG